nr:MAG: RNA-dependent RNA polymerase [Chemarfal virus 54]
MLQGVQGTTKFIIHNNSATNLRRALMERVFNVEVNGQLQRPPQPLPGIFASLLGLRDRIAHSVGKLSPVSRSNFVATRPVEKRKCYENAYASLQLTPTSVRDARVDGAFVKCEKINASKKGDPAPRIIQPRNARYNIEVGRYLVVAEHKIYNAIDELWGSPTVMKSYNVEEIGGIVADKWGKFTDPVALGLDASRFDQHVSVSALEFEHSLYNMIFDSPELGRLLRWQLDNRGVAHADDATFVYRKPGSRMSGDMNTALGNILIMCLMVYYYCSVRGVRAELVNNGDDCTLIFERADIPRLTDGLHGWFLQYGFNIVEEPIVDVIEEIEFCQMHPVCVNGRYKMVRNFWTSLSKDAVSIRSRTTTELRQWMHCVGKCGLSVASGVPVVQEYYDYYVRNGIKGKRLKDVETLEGRCGLTWFSRGLTAKSVDIDDLTRVSFYRAFGVDAAMQYALEGEFRELTFSANAPQADNYIVYT